VAGAEQAATIAWWVWPLALFAACFVLGIIAVPAGVGGGVLFVPIVAGFFPFHLDFVRGAGQLVALSGALAAAPRLLATGTASLRLGLTMGLVASVSSIAGAMASFAVNTATLQAALGLAILGIVTVMAIVQPSEAPRGDAMDALASALGLKGTYLDGATGNTREWSAHNALAAFFVFAGVGFIAGIFGLGAGWANVPAFNLLMGVPIKVAAGTSGLVITTSSSSASWIYLNHGAVLAIIAAPSVLGMILGAHIGARVLHKAPAAAIRKLVMALMVFAGFRALAKGLGWWN
jgi:uncharacterized membrane protein YfcA